VVHFVIPRDSRMGTGGPAQGRGERVRGLSLTRLITILIRRKQKDKVQKNQSKEVIGDDTSVKLASIERIENRETGIARKFDRPSPDQPGIATLRESK